MKYLLILIFLGLIFFSIKVQLKNTKKTKEDIKKLNRKIEDLEAENKEK